MMEQARFAKWGPLMVCRWLAIFLLVILPSVSSGSLWAQDVTGTVRDATTGLVVQDALIRVDSLGAVTLTGPDGVFELARIPKGTYTLTFQAFGYRADSLEVRVPLDEPLEVGLSPRPLELPGIEVVAESFETSFSKVQTNLDFRLALLPGYSRVVNAMDIRPYDERHAKNPWVFLHRAMRIFWTPREGVIRIRGRSFSPEAYVDDRRTWLFRLVEMPLNQLCRVELYEPPPFFPLTETPPLQLRAYTCFFMAQVALGERTMRSRINYGDLIAGPGGGFF